ncbi:hypothetical protein GE09DRAFT_977922, partial [Coniochaeta sp. 2T2.1]
TFGDPKVPDITRKISAYVSSRRQKIKCHITHPQQPCERCRKRGLSCTVNRSLQTILEHDAGWKDKLGETIQILTASVDLLAEHLNLPEAISAAPEQSRTPSLIAATSTSSITANATTSYMPSDVGPIEDGTQNPTPDRVGGIHPCLNPCTLDSSCHGPVSAVPRSERDIVDRGLVSLEQAELLFKAFHGSLDHYLYRIIPNVHSLDMAHSSYLQFCTVASLHHPDPMLAAVYVRCLRELIRLSASRMFSGRNTMYDIQAVVIGAFWLRDLAWTLSGTAVRMATELQFHRAILRLGEPTGMGDEQDYLKVRLYYLDYVCDHQLPIAYGRPPMTGEHEAIRLTSRFMKSPFVVEAIPRLTSQVQIWSITGQLFETFGTDGTQPVNLGTLPQLWRFSLALDEWRADLGDRFRTSKHVGNHPQKRVGLYYYFAKLYLCSHVFRGTARDQHLLLPDPEVQQRQKLHEMVEIPESAVSSATRILRAINTDIEWRSYLKELPLYIRMMIAFATVFLLRISTDCGGGIQVNADQAIQVVHQSFVVLESGAQNMKREHVRVRIMSRLGTIIDRCRQSRQSDMNHGWSAQAMQSNQRRLEQDAQKLSAGPILANAGLVGQNSGMVDAHNRPPVQDTLWSPDDMSWIHQLGSGLELYDLLQPSTGRTTSAMPEIMTMDLSDGSSNNMAIDPYNMLPGQGDPSGPSSLDI